MCCHCGGVVVNVINHSRNYSSDRTSNHMGCQEVHQDKLDPLKPPEYKNYFLKSAV
jgi:hypothetical protein